jgi:integrase
MLTAIECRNARPLAGTGTSAPKALKLFDGGGLFLLVKPNGAKFWRLKYRFGGVEKLLALGSFDLVSLAEAREKRDAAKKKLLDGIDPATVKEEAKAAAAVTFKVVGEDWLAKQGYAAATLAKARWLFDQWLYPDIGGRPVNDVKPAELLSIIRRAEDDNANETAHRIRSRASQVFRYAIAAGLGGCERDPSADLRGALAAKVVRNHAAVTEPRAVGALLRAIDGYDGQPSVALALKLSPHLFVRPGELRAAEWSEFDTKAKLWRIPGTRTKMRTEHLVPLSRQVVKLLEELKAHTGRGRFAFPAVGNSERFMSENTITGALRRLGYTGDEMTAHGFRAMASTLLNERDVAPDLIELQLAHRERNKVRAAYNRAERLKERTKMMQDWSNYLDKLRAAMPARGNGAR